MSPQSFRFENVITLTKPAGSEWIYFTVAL